MRPKELLSEYLNGRLSGNQLRDHLANHKSREAEMTLKLLGLEEYCRNVLEQFGPIDDAAERLFNKVLAVESWIKASDGRRSEGSLLRLIPALDVVGHSKPSEGKMPDLKKSNSTKRRRSTVTRKKKKSK